MSGLEPISQSVPHGIRVMGNCAADMGSGVNPAVRSMSMMAVSMAMSSPGSVPPAVQSALPVEISIITAITGSALTEPCISTAVP